MQDWYLMFDYLTDGDLMTDTAADSELSGSCLRYSEETAGRTGCALEPGEPGQHTY